ncbi:MAG: hypothetical protein WCI51_07225 [Lentisphaerota bacterium]
MKTKQTMYGGKNGIDIVLMGVVGDKLCVVGSGGSISRNLKIAREQNLALVKMETIRFRRASKKDDK